MSEREGQLEKTAPRAEALRFAQDPSFFIPHEETFAAAPAVPASTSQRIEIL
jgi:hypothetical protein